MGRVSPHSSRAAEKQKDRNRVEQDLVLGRKPLAQVKRENESFALGPAVARIRPGSARRVV